MSDLRARAAELGAIGSASLRCPNAPDRGIGAGLISVSPNESNFTASPTRRAIRRSAGPGGLGQQSSESEKSRLGQTDEQLSVKEGGYPKETRIAVRGPQSVGHDSCDGEGGLVVQSFMREGG